LKQKEVGLNLLTRARSHTPIDSIKNPTDGIKIDLPDEANIFSWHVFVRGPPDTAYEGGIFKLEMIFPKE
jgi:ubiquitin-protein ligase